MNEPRPGINSELELLPVIYNGIYIEIFTAISISSDVIYCQKIFSRRKSKVIHLLRIRTVTISGCLILY